MLMSLLLVTIKIILEHLKLIEFDTSRKCTHSTTYGINERSLLMRFNGFDVTKCLPFDTMHTIFEGVANLHLINLLPHLIDTKGYFTLEQLNNIIQSHQYGYSERDTKPSPIQIKSNCYIIKQSGMLLYMCINI